MIRKLFYTLPILVVLAAAIAFWPADDQTEQTNQVDTDAQEQVEAERLPEAQTAVQPAKKSIKDFGPDEFKDLFNGLALPNTIPIAEPPVITGDTAADNFIRSQAESRGYELRSVPSGKLISFQGVSVQPLLLEDWKSLAKAAEKDDISVFIRSAYRSVAEQRALFLTALADAGLSVPDLKNKSSSGPLNAVMDVTAPPGYSRHHHGYTLDLYDTSASVFEGSAAYAWLKRDNFANAKRFGFIPSYPDGASKQGPEPEAWEFVWVGRDFVLE